MEIIVQRENLVLWHLICFSVLLAFTACSDNKEEFQEYLTPAPVVKLFLNKVLALLKLLLHKVSVLRPDINGLLS